MSDTSTKILYGWSSTYPHECLGSVIVPSDHVPTLYQTDEIPPPPREGYAICRDVLDNSWVYEIDHRGKTYWEPGMSWCSPGIPVILPGDIPEECSFEPPTKPTTILREELLLKIENSRKRKINHGVTVDGVKFNANDIAQTRYMAFIHAHEDNKNYSCTWQASNGAWIVMTYDLCVRVQREAQIYAEQCHKWERDKRDELENTPDDRLCDFKV